MKKTFNIILAFIGLIGILSSCEKDETKVIMSADPIAPTLLTIPDLTLQRSKGLDTLIFVGTPVNPGFTASANYFLEACAAGNNFKDAVVIYSGIQDVMIKISVSDLNGILLKKFPADQVSSLDFRIRSVLVVDAGTGALGTSTKPLEYNSAVTNANVTLYGLPRLDLMDSGITQKIESALGDGKYTGLVKLDASMPFTLKDPDTEVVYGIDGAALKVDGTGILAGASGWYKLSVDVEALTYVMGANMIGLVGSATPNAWDSPDQKMDYDAQTGTWNITLDLINGDIKFRLNDGWAWNLGGTAGSLTHDGPNIPVTAGNYTISLTITNETQGTESGTFSIVKN